jgi:hypothetical protein
MEVNLVPGVFLAEIVHLEEMPRINWTRLKAVIQIKLMSLKNSIFYVTTIQLSIRDLLMLHNTNQETRLAAGFIVRQAFFVPRILL